MREPETFRYDDDIVRKFVVATILWGAVGMLVGLWLALQLAVPGWQKRVRVTLLGPDRGGP
jgi:cytochrome c oxidase cbb3-type subunit I/II